MVSGISILRRSMPSIPVWAKVHLPHPWKQWNEELTIFTDLDGQMKHHFFQLRGQYDPLHHGPERLRWAATF